MPDRSALVVVTVRPLKMHYLSFGPVFEWMELQFAPLCGEDKWDRQKTKGKEEWDDCSKNKVKAGRQKKNGGRGKRWRMGRWWEWVSVIVGTWTKESLKRDVVGWWHYVLPPRLTLTQLLLFSGTSAECCFSFALSFSSSSIKPLSFFLFSSFITFILTLALHLHFRHSFYFFTFLNIQYPFLFCLPFISLLMRANNLRPCHLFICNYSIKDVN